MLDVKSCSLKKGRYFVAADEDGLHIFKNDSKTHVLDLQMDECTITVPLEKGEITNTFFVIVKDTQYNFHTNSKDKYCIWVYLLASQMKTNGLFSLPIHVISFKTKTLIPLPALRCLEYLTKSLNELRSDFYKKVLSDREKKEVFSIITSFRKENDVDSVTFSSPIVARHVLMKFISTLPLPLIPTTSSTQLVMSFKQNNSTLTKKVLTKLPDDSKYLVYALIKFVTQTITMKHDFLHSASSFLSNCLETVDKSNIVKLLILFDSNDFINTIPDCNDDIPNVNYPAKIYQSIPPFPSRILKQLNNQNTKQKKQQQLFVVNNHLLQSSIKTLRPTKSPVEQFSDSSLSPTSKHSDSCSSPTPQHSPKRNQQTGTPNKIVLQSTSLSDSPEITVEGRKKMSSLTQTSTIVDGEDSQDQLSQDPNEQLFCDKRGSRSKSGQCGHSPLADGHEPSDKFSSTQPDIRSPINEPTKWIVSTPRSLPLSPSYSPSLRQSPRLEKQQEYGTRHTKKLSKLQFFKEISTNPRVKVAKRIVELECLYEELKTFSTQQQEVIERLRKSLKL
ncbi:hypothetical protein QTN25_005468 [Entamoeba marina]